MNIRLNWVDKFIARLDLFFGKAWYFFKVKQVIDFYSKHKTPYLALPTYKRSDILICSCGAEDISEICFFPSNQTTPVDLDCQIPLATASITQKSKKWNIWWISTFINMAFQHKMP